MYQTIQVGPLNYPHINMDGGGDQQVRTLTIIRTIIQSYQSIFKTNLAINWHIRKKHKKKKIFKYLMCGKACISDLAINRHIRSKHKKKKIFSCMICGNACTSNSAMYQHIRM